MYGFKYKLPIKYTNKFNDCHFEEKNFSFVYPIQFFYQNLLQ